MKLKHTIDGIALECAKELRNASEKFGKFASSHEGFAVIHEEFDELKEQIWKNQFKFPERKLLMRKEAIQLAAMAMRLIYDICDEEDRS